MKIWLDDLRMAPEGWVHVRNFSELEKVLSGDFSEIDVMSFDNDLGENEVEGYDILKWLASRCLDEKDFRFWPKEIRIHSANPPARENLAAFAECFEREVVNA